MLSAVLSPDLAPPCSFPRNARENVVGTFRFERLLLKLKTHVEARDIICLQEVNREWYSRLCVFFENSRYFVQFSGYGSARTGYMGVLVAWNTNDFSLTDSSIVRIGDALTDEDVPPDLREASPVPQQFQSVYDRLRALYYWIRREDAPKEPKSVIKAAMERDNCAVFVCLRPTRNQAGVPALFWVGTYHMPCVYGSRKKEAVAWAHVKGIRRLCVECMHLRWPGAATIPLILAGDFNCTPSSVAYDMMTTRDTPDGLKFTRYVSMCSSLPCVSAYKCTHGEEPPFTNNAWPDYLPDKFRETLDYIFIAGSIRAESVGDLATHSNELLPNQYEPSDHLLLKARVENMYTTRRM